MRHILDKTAVFLALLVLAAPASAEPRGCEDFVRDGEVVVDRQPNQAGGLGADTEFALGVPFWERCADDILLNTSALIEGIVWWGFYDLDNPPATETMRIRFYAPRAGGGLPGEVLYEQSFLDPLRVATGKRVWVGVDPDEYAYEVDLPTPFELAADTPYWLEIVQVGDVDTAFRWEFSGLGDVGLALVNASLLDWEYTTFDADNAFQLLTIPEPSALGLMFLGATLAGKWRSRKEV